MAPKKKTENNKEKSFKNGAKMRSEDDAFGSYTGVVLGDCHDKPIQDADDL